jgi:hypothetical protein
MIRSRRTGSALDAGRPLMRAVMVVLAAFVLGLAAPVQAEEAFGDWSVGISDDAGSIYAGTVNDSGEMLAEICYFENRNCFWVLGMKTKCEEDAEYPILINSSGGARHVTVTCFAAGLKGGDHLYGMPWKEIEESIKGQEWVGIALPMQGDAFKVVRFSLDGIDQATDEMEGAFRKILDGGARPRSTKTQIL